MTEPLERWLHRGPRVPLLLTADSRAGLAASSDANAAAWRMRNAAEPPSVGMS